jgi:hypothetical protein
MAYPRGAMGHARVSVPPKSAWGVCDRDGQRYLRSELSYQYEWQGRQLQNLRILVCPRCYDIPQPQLFQYAPPPDPVPIYQARPDLFPTAGNMGFTPYNLLTPTTLVQPGGMPGFSPFTPWPITKANALASLALRTGVPTPGALADWSITPARDVVTTLLPANPFRAWLAVYSPGGIFVFSTGTALVGSQTSTFIDPGEAWFWPPSAIEPDIAVNPDGTPAVNPDGTPASGPGSASVYQGALTVISIQGSNPIWAWDSPPSPYSIGTLFNDGGVLIVSPSTTFANSMSGLAAGAIWSNGGVVSVVPGATPNPLASPVIFGGITAAGLQALTGANLQTTQGPLGSGILWNASGEVQIS